MLCTSQSQCLGSSLVFMISVNVKWGSGNVQENMLASCSDSRRSLTAAVMYLSILLCIRSWVLLI